MRRAALRLACALLVVLAGCSLDPGSQQSTSTLTPAEVSPPPTTAGSTGTMSPASATPATDIDFEVDVRVDVHALVAAHTRTLTRPRTRPIPDGSDLLGRLGGSLLVTDAVQRDGERGYVLRTDQQTTTPPDEPRRYVRVVVDERGLVSNHTFGTVIPDEGLNVLDTFTVSDVGSTTVDAPAWVDPVRDAPVDADTSTGTAVVTHADLGATLRVTTDANSLRDVDLRPTENDVFTSRFVERAPRRWSSRRSRHWSRTPLSGSRTTPTNCLRARPSGTEL